MAAFKKLFDIRKASFILIAFPYIGFHWRELYQSPFYTGFNAMGLLFALLVIELLFKLYTSKFQQRAKLVSVLMIACSILFFFGANISELLFIFLNRTFGLLIRGRITLSIVFFILVALQYYLLRKKTSYYYLNIFLIIFGAIAFMSMHNANNGSQENINDIASNYISIKKDTLQEKPVLLIIADEYNAPSGLYQIYKDSSLFNFSKQLTQNHWTVHENSYSYETSTINSLSSLFNYNLSKDTNYANQNLAQVGIHKLLHASLYDSLAKKNIKVVNFGIFDLGAAKPLTKLYSYPHSFIDHFLMYSAFSLAEKKTNNFNKKGFDVNYFVVDEHNKYILNKLSDSLQNIPSTKLFSYVHLYMPHAPLQFEPEFKRKELLTLDDYLAYWRFSNTKIAQLLNTLTKENKYKIIFTGDHGYRGDARINKHITFTAYYGFEPTQIDKIKSVQDLGSLINASY